MNADRYEFSNSGSLLNFEFCSEGINGLIKKVVTFSPRHIEGKTYFNPGFGDLNEKNGTIDDLSRSNNGDRDKILATIASAVLAFIAHFPDVIVFAIGSTPARTRLYQMAVCSNYMDIKNVLYIDGFINGRWQEFTPNVNYEAFLVMHK